MVCTVRGTTYNWWWETLSRFVILLAILIIFILRKLVSFTDQTCSLILIMPICILSCNPFLFLHWWCRFSILFILLLNRNRFVVIVILEKLLNRRSLQIIYMLLHLLSICVFPVLVYIFWVEIIIFHWGNKRWKHSFSV